MSALTWTRAAALLRLPRAEGWPAALEPLQCAALQTGYSGPVERREAHLIAAALTDACRAAEIACEAANRVAQPARRRVGTIGPAQPRQWPQPAPPVRTVGVYRIGPHPFAEWLRAQGVEPSALVAAWVASQAAPVAQPAPAEGGKIWTAVRIAEARAMRDKLKAAGHRDYAARTAAHYRVSPQRLREAIGDDKPKRTPKRGTPQGAIARLVHRLK